MFVNLTCRKPNGDFYITSSDVERDKLPELHDCTDDEMMDHILLVAKYFVKMGFAIEVTQCEC